MATTKAATTNGKKSAQYAKAAGTELGSELQQFGTVVDRPIKLKDEERKKAARP